MDSDGNTLPSPDELDRVRDMRTGGGRGKGNKTMQNIAGIAGNVLEWYDFAVFGYFSDIIGTVFFPPQAGHSAMIEAFAVFGLAFICRPIGGMTLGYIGDVYGRKRALEISIFLMAFPTFLMGCLPSYERVGNLAIVLLILVRMLQGLSVGGQLVSSLVFTLENNPRSQWGRYGSYVMAAANYGTLLGGMIAFLLRQNLTEDQLKSWGWRLPFLSGILVSLSGIYLKYYCDEDTIDRHHGGGNNAQATTNPLKAAFSRNNLQSLLAASMVPMLWSGGFYITFVWMATFMADIVDPPVPGAFGVNSLALLLSVCLLFPFAGVLSDKIGRKKTMLTGGILIGFLSPLAIMVIASGNAVAAFFAQWIMGISLSLWGAPMCAWLVEGFPVSVRLTSVGVGYNIAQALIGGTAPAIATLLVDKQGNRSPGFLISGIAILSVTGLCIAPPHTNSEVVETSEQPEDGSESSNSHNIAPGVGDLELI